MPQVLAPELAAHIPDSRLVLLNSRHHVLTQAEPAWPVFLQELDWSSDRPVAAAHDEHDGSGLARRVAQE